MGLLFSSHLLGQPTLTPGECIFLALLKKKKIRDFWAATWSCHTGSPKEITWGCNTDLSFTSNFCCKKTELRKLKTPPTVPEYFSLHSMRPSLPWHALHLSVSEYLIILSLPPVVLPCSHLLMFYHFQNLLNITSTIFQTHYLWIKYLKVITAL